MNHATMLNIENSFKDVSLQNDVTEEAFKKEALKYKSKAEKINRKQEEQLNEVEIIISNPFNLMYEICVNNLLHTEWELRHLAVLILKELLVNCDFLGYSQSLMLSKQDSR
jgi:CRISPR/Cas system CSM-associated protein Csm3 (group 7 of RAMP superfamily)